MQEGRVDQPPGDNAWFHYRIVQQLDPSNAAARAGLYKVQQVMIERARQASEDLDFEYAAQLLNEAARVRESSELIDRARVEFQSFRDRHAAELEASAIREMEKGNFQQAERVLIDLIALGGADDLVGQLRQRLQEARDYGGFRPGRIISDDFLDGSLSGPQCVVMPTGSFMMGSPDYEKDRKDNEGPQHRVTFQHGFAIGRTEVTVGEFGQFVNLSGYRTDAEKHGFSIIYNHRSSRLMRRDDVSWNTNYEGRSAGEDEPVVHVSWNDATAYVKWLARGTGKPYRLPSESEFEYALRGGKTTLYWWGDSTPLRAVENLTGELDISPAQRQWSSYFEGYTDRYWGPAPVATMEPNPFGLYDMGGNAGEWVSDCWHDGYLRAPSDGSPWLNPGCRLRVVRGGYWASSPDQARSAYRLSAQPDRRDARIGFRVAKDL
jgi:formylglycine-generating enzyme required for sulfatase activity